MIKYINNITLQSIAISNTKTFQVRVKEGGFTPIPGKYELEVTILGHSFKLDGWVNISTVLVISSYRELENQLPDLATELTNNEEFHQFILTFINSIQNKFTTLELR